MATGLQKQEGVPENHLKQQLAVAVRSIQWSYAIFWTMSTRNQGVLEWGAGYYNGDIKTRKTLQPMEFNANQLGLQRSEQLRELYESLSVGETNQQARRPSASLSPEDLSDAEWFYLVCMSFTFNPGQGLPGKALANGQHIWLCDAHCADSKVFIRSLLAKSASIQQNRVRDYLCCYHGHGFCQSWQVLKTVVCFPFLGGVVELGATELFPEDLTLLQHVKTVFLEFKKPSCSDHKSPSSPCNGDKNDEDPVGTGIDHEITDTVSLKQLNTAAECEIQPPPFNLPHSIPKEEIELDQNGIKELNTNICEDLITDSPEDSSNGCEPNQQTEDSYMMDGANGGASQVQSWQFMDDELELSNGIHGSMNSSDCISQTFLNPRKVFSSSKMKKINSLQGLQECNHTKLSELDLGTDDLHYSRTLSTIFKTSNLLIVAPCSRSGNHKSSFGSWKKGGLVDSHKLQTGKPQKMLKRILFEVAWMHSGCSLKTREEKEVKNGIWKPEGDDIGLGHETKREELNEKFIVLRSLVPSVKKFDKASILNDTIDYLKELERRVEELESCREPTECEAREKRKHPDIVERTSDNYGHNEIANGKKPVINKRKACDIDEMEPEQNWILPKDGLATYVTVCMIEKEILIEISCPWRECLLLEIMDAISDLQLDAHSVQSSTADGILTLNLKSKFKGAVVASAGMIKQAIQRIIGKV